eukprot:jgi/Orpsp1_1/1190208/evm.model.d7180000077430.1
MNAYLIYFIILAIVCIALTFLFKQQENENEEKKEEENNHSKENIVEYQKLNKSYLIVYFLIVTGDWLQGPYNYSQYQNFGLSLEEIGWMSVCGFLSSLILGTYIGSTADK